MKKYIPLLLATSLLLSACSVDWNDEKVAPVENTSKPVEPEDTFKKKQECAKYKDEMFEDLKTRFPNYWSDILTKEHLYIEEIFYSPAENSCFYSWVLFFRNINADILNYSIVDYFSRKEFLNTYEACNVYLDLGRVDYQKKCSALAKEKIRELKWE